MSFVGTTIALIWSLLMFGAGYFTAKIIERMKFNEKLALEKEKLQIKNKK